MQGHLEITTRPVEPEDRAFRFALFEQTSKRTFGSLDLALALKQQLLECQFEARNTGWHAAHPEGKFHLILGDRKACGEWIIDESGDEIILVYAALLEAFRGRGVIAALTRNLMARARETDRSIIAHVEAANPARAIWVHLGFKVTGDCAPYERLEYHDGS